MLDKAPAEVTKDERDSVKPVSFGRPGGMGPERLRQIAKASYGVDLTLEEVEERIEAYHGFARSWTASWTTRWTPAWSSPRRWT